MTTSPRQFRVTIEVTDYFTVDVVALDETSAIELVREIDPVYWKHGDDDFFMDRVDPITDDSFDPPSLPASAWTRT